MIPGEKILAKLSYTHIEQLLGIKDSLKRTFYELECIKGTWSLRELKRQINSYSIKIIALLFMYFFIFD
jgi:hypothetical protein